MEREEDYLIPVLAPYVQWVKAYKELLSTLYKEHKTVRRVWKAFREAMPQIEQRLQFSAFEQILLFSLFLSEWDKSEPGHARTEKAEPTMPDASAHLVKDPERGLDTVILDLQETVSKTDKAIEDFDLHQEEYALIIEDRQTYLQTR
jgi:hypothetical protein